ncbi:MAG: hypothetical protein NTW97_01960 [Candidatus Krumholzibacteria bacterium]|nr:hypothetical protein [Candidatus Krumholzibacteria bacterium]
MLNKKMTKNSIGIAVLLMAAFGFGAAKADDMTASGNPGALIIGSATAGSVLIPVSDATTTYNIDVTTGTVKITGEINTAMPANTALKVMLAAPTGATSVGMVTLSATAQNLVTGIANLTSENGLGISYEFDASVSAGVVSSAAKTVTFTIAAN